MRRSEVEDAGVLQEEIALLGEVERKAGQVRLLFVDFDLGEVGVVGQVERQGTSHAPLEIEAAVAVGDRVRFEPRVLADVADHEGLDLELGGLGESGQTGQFSGHRDAVDRLDLGSHLPEHADLAR